MIELKIKNNIFILSCTIKLFYFFSITYKWNFYRIEDLKLFKWPYDKLYISNYIILSSYNYPIKCNDDYYNAIQYNNLIEEKLEYEYDNLI